MLPPNLRAGFFRFDPIDPEPDVKEMMDESAVRRDAMEGGFASPTGHTPDSGMATLLRTILTFGENSFRRSCRSTRRRRRKVPARPGTWWPGLPRGPVHPGPLGRDVGFAARLVYRTREHRSDSQCQPMGLHRAGTTQWHGADRACAWAPVSARRQDDK